MSSVDAIVVGSGPNGLVAANMLVDRGWDVLMLEADAEPGGAVRSINGHPPNFIHDRFSAFYPLAVASPAMRSLELERYGLRWTRAPLVVAHPGGEGASTVLSQNVEETADSFDAGCAGDGAAWMSLYRKWEHVGDAVLSALLGPYPPVRPALTLGLRLRRDLLPFMRFALLPVRRFAVEHFGGRGPAMLLTGNAMHADLAPESPLSGFFGWLLCCLGQQYGFPVPQGGAGQLTAALVRRFETMGGRLTCRSRVTRVLVKNGRAEGVETSSGERIYARRAVLADVGAPSLYFDLLGPEQLPGRAVDAMKRFEYDSATVKIDWALDGPIPWLSQVARRAGTLHVADGIDHLSYVAADLAAGIVPARPFVVMGQMTTADPSRSPAGTEAAWAYAHVPQKVRGDAGGTISGSWDERDRAQFQERIEELLDEHAPGFRDRIIECRILGPRDLQAANANLVGGAINGGTAMLHQQIVFRPTPRLAPASTPIANLFLASASAHPGGGVHGACGANAARAALRENRRQRFWRVVAGAQSSGKD